MDMEMKKRAIRVKAAFPKPPPNCPHFAKVKPFGIVFYYENPKSSNAAFWILLTMDMEFPRRLVASVAIEYWRIEEYKNGGFDEAELVDSPHNKKVFRAQDMQAAWRAWAGIKNLYWKGFLR